MPAAGYFELSTDQIAARERQEFWRDTVLNRSDADFRPDAAANGFSASVKGYIGTRAELRYGRLAEGVLRRGAARCRRDGGDEILLAAVASPDDRASYQDGTGALTLPAGRFLVVDMSVPFELEMGQYRAINFRLPRAAVARATRARPAGLTGHLLAATPLTSLLFDQVARFCDLLPAMDDAAREVALDATADFALAALRLEVESNPWNDGVHWRGLWQAAERYIERNLDRVDLNPDTLAHALRCSRTHLYRLFAREDTTVMDHIRETRLNRCRKMLGDPACHLSIAEIATLCGIDNSSAFSRGFRRRFGCTPSEMRRASRR